MEQRPLSHHTITSGVIVALLTVLLAPAPATAGIDLLGGDEEDASDDSGSEAESAEGDRSEGGQSGSSSGSSEENLGKALGDVVNSVTGASEPERQAAADGEEPQEVTPDGGGSAGEPAQQQSGGDGGGGQPQPDGSAGQQAASGGGSQASQPAGPSGPRRATRPGVRSNGQPPASLDPGGSGFDSVNRGAYEPQVPEVLSEDPSDEGSGSDVAALPSIPLVNQGSGSGAEVPNEYVAAACALLVILAGAHSMHATRRFGATRELDH